jgi:hypothetical protein
VDAVDTRRADDGLSGRLEDGYVDWGMVKGLAGRESGEAAVTVVIT